MRASSLSAVILASVLFAVSVVHADETASVVAAGEPTVTSSPDADDRMVCEYEKSVGSHMKKRICKTVAQRNRDREDAQGAMSKRSVCGNCKSD